ncbi:helix-turn-helix domain-containing protein [Brevundimonas sp. 2R-24]|uniref:Helix-turn-helix domain-containing protein n=1 Tax=Peiella sedimenti TaxID=3061083 RepID=A0ABT8SK35_9CAUL|nr:helix-turn-helix domain-containing protein [Caulobacteraceae bacterium XZ-24]
MDLTAAIVLAGALDAALLALLILAARRREPRDTAFAGLLVVLAVVITCILITHRYDGAVESLAVAVEQIGTLVAGPMLLAYVALAVGRPLSRRASLWIAGPLLALGLICFVPTATGRWPALPAHLQVAVIAAFSLISAAVFVRAAPWLRSDVPGFWRPLAVLSTMGAIHIGQAVRFLTPAHQDAVAVAGSLGGLALFALALVAATAHTRVTQGRYARSGLQGEALMALRDRVRAVLDAEDAPWRRPDFSLEELARRTGVPPHHVSQALSAADSSFAIEVTARRVEDARRRLTDPANARVAVEPLGMEAGFRSRSTFYAAFTEATGLTPAEYRRRTIVSGPTGADTDARAEDRRAE